MTTAVIIDIVIVVALVAFTLRGAKRGLFQALAGLVIAVAALVGAAMIASTFSAPVAKLVAPIVEEHFVDQIDSFMEQQMEQAGIPEGTDLQIQSALDGLDLEDSFLGGVLSSVGGAAAEAGQTVLSAAVESVAQSLAYGILFILAYIVLAVLLRVLAGAMGLLTKLPGISGLNSLGGAVFGLLEGALLVFLVVYMLRNLGVSMETPALQEAHILRIFTENTPLSVIFALF